MKKKTRRRAATGKFRNWVEKEGGFSNVARKLGLSSHTPQFWFTPKMEKRCSPTPRHMIALVKLSRGYLTCDDIVFETMKARRPAFKATKRSEART